MSLQSKRDFANVLLKILEPLKNHYSEGKALLYVGETGAVYDEKTIGLEGFARILWGLVPLWAGGGENSLDKFYVEGIIHGTDPKHVEYWGKGSDYHQMFVEMVPIALGILIAPQFLWEPLSAGERKRFARWLYQINEYVIPMNNWQFLALW